MKKIKHVKYKNTGIIFELLCKQVTSDILTNSKKLSLDIIKKYFKPGTELNKELTCYRSLIESRNISPTAASKLIDIVLGQRYQINEKKLNKEKYNLIGEIKSNYTIENFFESRIPEYKLYASLYKMFEYKSSENPLEHVSCYGVVLEHIEKKPTSKQAPKTNIDIWNEQTDDVKEIASSMIIKRFNQKYAKALNENQKQLINKFVSENTELQSFRDFIYTEVSNIQERLGKIQKKCGDKALKIKLNEVVSLSQTILTSKHIKDEHISSMLKYYELIDVLGKRYK